MFVASCRANPHNNTILAQKYQDNRLPVTIEQK
jgi:hypothetical protein